MNAAPNMLRPLTAKKLAPGHYRITYGNRIWDAKKFREWFLLELDPVRTCRPCRNQEETWFPTLTECKEHARREVESAMFDKAREDAICAMANHPRTAKR